MIEKIRKLLLQECNVLYNTKLNVENYEQVINVWLKYKNEKKLYLDMENRHLIKSIFDFHKKNIDHVILYYSKGMIDSLIMCKINDKYVNIKLPIENNVFSIKKSFIAVYC
tara:strand:+ start:32 stop:364 length:333 start_codon:yes stop_codon:yes gene_type:complete